MKFAKFDCEKSFYKMVTSDKTIIAMTYSARRKAFADFFEWQMAPNPWDPGFADKGRRDS